VTDPLDINSDAAEFRAALARERRNATAATGAFLRALVTANPEDMLSSMEALDRTGAWTAALRKVARLRFAPEETQRYFLMA
jgi:hypothetical protein